MGMRNCFRFATIVFSCGLVLTLAFSLTATAQSVPLPLFASPQPPVLSPRGECLLLTRTMCDGLPSGQNRAGNEYPRWWVNALFYGAAATVSVTRFTAHDHFAADTFVGTALGYFIGRHIFHAHCNPDFSEACR